MAADIQFEKALERLEHIVQDLEMGNVTLDEALKKYEEGVKLSRACQEKLGQAEKKIEVLTQSGSGTLKKERFVFEEGMQDGSSEDSGQRKNRKSSVRKKATDNQGDEDLLI